MQLQETLYWRRLVTIPSFALIPTLGRAKYNEVVCTAVRLLCSVERPFGLWQIKNEVNILHNYLLISDGNHFPMMIP